MFRSHIRFLVIVELNGAKTTVSSVCLCCVTIARDLLVGNVPSNVRRWRHNLDKTHNFND